MGVLDEAKFIVAGKRQNDYGSPAENHGCTATMWSAYLYRRFGLEACITGRDVCLMNILQKVSRDANSPQHDNAVDIAGYAENAEACGE